ELLRARWTVEKPGTPRLAVRIGVIASQPVILELLASRVERWMTAAIWRFPAQALQSPQFRNRVHAPFGRVRPRLRLSMLDPTRHWNSGCNSERTATDISPAFAFTRVPPTPAHMWASYGAAQARSLRVLPSPERPLRAGSR